MNYIYYLIISLFIWQTPEDPQKQIVFSPSHLKISYDGCNVLATGLVYDKIEVFNLIGGMVPNTESLPKGIYFVKVSGGYWVAIKKIQIDGAFN